MPEWDLIEYNYYGYSLDTNNLSAQDMCDANGDIMICGDITSPHYGGESEYSLFRYDLAEQEIVLIVEGSEFESRMESLFNGSMFYPNIHYSRIIDVVVTHYFGSTYVHFNFQVENNDPTGEYYVTWRAGALGQPIYIYDIISVTYKVDLGGSITEIYNTISNYMLWKDAYDNLATYFQKYSYVTTKDSIFTAYFNCVLNGAVVPLPEDTEVTEYRWVYYYGLPLPPTLGDSGSFFNFNNIKMTYTSLGCTLTESDLSVSTWDTITQVIVPEEEEITYYYASNAFWITIHDIVGPGINKGGASRNIYPSLVQTPTEEQIFWVNINAQYSYSGEYDENFRKYLEETLQLRSLNGEVISEQTYSHDTDIDAGEYSSRQSATYTTYIRGLISFDNYYMGVDEKKLPKENLFIYKPWSSYYNYTTYNPDLIDPNLLTDTLLELEYPEYFWWFSNACKYLENSSISISLPYTDYDDPGGGTETIFEGDTRFMTSIPGVNLFGLQLNRAIQTTGGIYILDSDGIFALDYIPSYKIKPTSITTDYDTIHIGGQLIMDYITISGIFLGSGSPTYRNPMYINALIPEITTISGDYSSVVMPRYRRIGYSGLAYTKRYNIYESFIYGNITPFRAALAGRSSFFDISYNLPSGIDTSSVAYASSSNLLTEVTGVIYEMILPSGELWSVYDTISPINTSHLSYLGELFAAQTGGAYSVGKTPSVYMPVWEKADYNLPAGALVLDLEEDSYADR